MRNTDAQVVLTIARQQLTPQADMSISSPSSQRSASCAYQIFIDASATAFAQTLSNVNLNYAYNIRELFHIHGGDGTIEGMESKETGRFRDLPKEGVFELPEPITLRAVEDVRSLDFRFKPSFKPMKNFKPIPFEHIGFVRDEFRPSPPDKKTYRSAIDDKFKNDKATRYDPRVVNARYPTPAYLE